MTDHPTPSAPPAMSRRPTPQNLEFASSLLYDDGHVDDSEVVANAAEHIASLTTQLEAERERAARAEAALREKAMEYLALDQQATEALARAVKVEEELDGWRKQMTADAGEIAQLREALYRIANIGAGSGALTRYKRLIEAEDIARAALKTGEPSHD